MRTLHFPVDRIKKIDPKRALGIGLFFSLMAVSAFLRFKDLGYSEFQDDEKKAIAVTKNFTWDFFMNQRKGPMQFLVTKATNLFEPDIRNEIAYRMPFTTANLLSVVVMWLILKRIFNSPLLAFLGSLVYAVNGFTLGFSRIAQYQNLNLLFSLLSLYFFLRLYQDKEKPLLNSLLGTTFFCLSLLSHWDAIFFVLPIASFYLGYVKTHKDQKRVSKVALANLVLGCLLLLPFLIPYVINHRTNQGNMDYFADRVGVSTYPIERHKMIFELYNPFAAIYFIPVIGLFAFLKPKKYALFILWSVLNFLLIRVFMQKPGTHIYNYVIPMIFLFTAGISVLSELKRRFAIPLIIPILLVSAFLTYQSYILFVDHFPEYPWYEKEVLSYKKINLIAPQYEDKEVLTFGFPHFRNWKEINEVIAGDPEGCTYITNEGKEISQIYMDSKFGIPGKECYYIINIKRPFITRGNGASFAKAAGKPKIYTYTQDERSFVDVFKIKSSLQAN